MAASLRCAVLDVPAEVLAEFRRAGLDASLDVLAEFLAEFRRAGLDVLAEVLAEFPSEPIELSVERVLSHGG